MKIIHTHQKNIANGRHQILLTCLRVLWLLSAIWALAACAPTTRTSSSEPVPQTPERATAEVQVQQQKNLGVVAVAEVVIEHPAALRVFSEQVVRDAIAREVHQTGQVKVLDWSRLKAVLFRRNLEWSDLVENAAERKQVKDVLLNDYFLTGSLYSYGERMEYSSSAFSKAKTQIAEVVIDLFLKDALSNEVIASARGTGTQKRTLTQSLGFGAAGGSDPSLAKAALDVAVGRAVGDLLEDLEIHSTNILQKEKAK